MNKQYIVHKFLVKNTSLSTLSGLREALCVVTMLPEVLNRRSDGELVAQTDK